ncbi:MAG: AAA family ATPase [Clostridium sp.]|uniref:AAA family ATPase n=1 Tax=Clostridium sp. TaxID=1506 RepID=UPI003EE6C3FD
MAGFKKATRENIWVKGISIAPSGAGKTFSNLRMATGMKQEMEKVTGEEASIAFIDTEARRSTYYADEFDFDILELKAPFTPEKYIDAIDEAIDAGYKILVIDSLSHEWNGKGGILEIHGNMPGNSYTNWSKITPRHEKFTDKLIDSPIHLFATVRGKDKYVLEEQNGKQVPRKVGVGYQQRDDLEYLFTAAFNLEQDTHYFSTVKDNTHLFEDRHEVLTEKDGIALYKWATGGDVKAKKRELEKAKEEAKANIKLKEDEEAREKAKELENKKKKQEKKLTTEELKTSILLKCKELSDQGKRPKVISTLEELNGTPNPNDIKSKSVAEKVLSALEDLE